MNKYVQFYSTKLLFMKYVMQFQKKQMMHIDRVNVYECVSLIYHLFE